MRLESPLLRLDIPICHKFWSGPEAPPPLLSPPLKPPLEELPSPPKPRPAPEPDPRNSNLY